MDQARLKVRAKRLADTEERVRQSSYSLPEGQALKRCVHSPNNPKFYKAVHVLGKRDSQSPKRVALLLLGVGELGALMGSSL